MVDPIRTEASRTPSSRLRALIALLFAFAIAAAPLQSLARLAAAAPAPAVSGASFVEAPSCGGDPAILKPEALKAQIADLKLRQSLRTGEKKAPAAARPAQIALAHRLGIDDLPRAAPPPLARSAVPDIPRPSFHTLPAPTGPPPSHA